MEIRPHKTVPKDIADVALRLSILILCIQALAIPKIKSGASVDINQQAI